MLQELRRRISAAIPGWNSPLLTFICLGLDCDSLGRRFGRSMTILRRPSASTCCQLNYHDIGNPYRPPPRYPLPGLCIKPTQRGIRGIHNIHPDQQSHPINSVFHSPIVLNPNCERTPPPTHFPSLAKPSLLNLFVYHMFNGLPAFGLKKSTQKLAVCHIVHGSKSKSYPQ